jgi:acyl dehydratase
MLKKQSYQAVEIGERFGPTPLLVDEHFVQGFAFAVDDFGPAYFQAPGVCGPSAHSSGIAKKMLHQFMEVYDPQAIRSVHLKEDIWFDAPVPFGETVTLSGEYTDKFVRRGRPSVTLESVARDRSGRALVRQRSVEIVPTLEKVEESEPRPFDGLSGRRVSPEMPASAPVAATVADLTKPDSPLPVMMKTIHQDQMSVFVGANEGWRNIHTDPEVARREGFNGSIMSGMIQACWFSQMMIAFFGAEFLSGGRLGVTFLAPVEAGETIACHGVVRSMAAGGAVEVEFWSLNAAGKMTAGGWAIGNKS